MDLRYVVSPIRVARIAQPGEHQPVGKLINDQVARERWIGGNLGLDTLSPSRVVRVGGVVPLTHKAEEIVGVEVDASHSVRLARSRPGSGDSSAVLPSTQSISALVAWPAMPAALTQRSAPDWPDCRHRASGSTPSASASRGRGHQAEFISYRTKAVDTVLGEIAVRRAYYHCEECEHWFCPRDRELGMEGGSLSPGMLRMVCRTGSDEPFGEARRDLKELVGVELTAKRIERATEAAGESVRLGAEQESDGIVSGQIPPAVRAEPVPKPYITLDGTGVPTVPKENQAGAAKGPAAALTPAR